MNRKQRRAAPNAGRGSPNAGRGAAGRPAAAIEEQMVRQAGALFQAGRHDECAALCQKILAGDPNHSEANLLTGLLALSSGHNSEALTHLRSALSGNRKNPVIHANLGLALSQTGQWREARQSLQIAIRLQPAYLEAHTNLANVEMQLGHPDKAVAHHAKALSFRPGAPLLRANLASALLRNGETEAAANAYRALLEEHPDHAEAHFGLGLACREAGDLVEAGTHLRKATVLAPPHAEAILAWVMLADTLSDADIASIEAAREATLEGSHDRMQIDFALSKIAHDRGDYHRAATTLRAANTRRRQDLDYQRSEVEAAFAETTRVFDADFFAERAGFGHPDDTPLFILGMPRSGTSLIEQILASHPQVHGAGELTLLRDIAGGPQGPKDSATPPAFAAALSRGASATVGRNYLRQLQAQAPQARFITDKMPGNFMLIGLIRLILPKARIIHCRRDPRDTCLSIYRTNFSGNGLAFAYDIDDLVHYYGLYQDLMAHWHALFGDTIIEAEYERLIADPETEIRALLARCDLPFDSQVMAFHETRRPVRTASAAQVRRPLYASSRGNWRAYAEYLPELARLTADP
ncbi:tetratricopeptide repeat-containing sulfotransferase family protein [Pseudohoeflea coraliihabitans]|uniref:Sulfotransferase n=1 Tax=Pseudohoeflea coraliihabitans TaxID=2860393 RepID=A0ABS6WJR9_9HYPH|nr:tetratricopeptide repeat-containing sulfotransferase family protein [Pseudohoeflea sp. DP4N28-3]MBW3095712.1 sulfotransferase [Pseudohoeflea sp. DP4N28-3]